MSERRIGDWNDYEEWAKSKNACTGAPAAIQPGAAVAMAEALESCEDVLSDRFDYPQVIYKARAALALYNGTGE